MDQATRAELVALLPRLSRFARSLTRVRHEADDLVQTACERALRGIGKWQASERLDGWVFRILHNAWIDQKRAEAPRRAYAEAVQQAEEAPDDGESGVIALLTLRAVNDALHTLPHDQKEVLLLVCVEGFSYAQAAAILGIPIGTVMSRLARGRLGLHRLINPPTPGDAPPVPRASREVV
jgi:RNA polymerase sigma-70 factor (ECF subfamily)